MLTITHTPAEGTLIEGTSKGDGTNEVLKVCRWRWSRNMCTWYVPQSRDRAANQPLIDNTAAQLRAAGHEVSVHINAGHRPTAEVEADKIDRQDHRADALASKAARLAHVEAAADTRAHELADRVPFGQPILIGHHSQRKMERHYEQVERAQRAAVETGREADAAARAAQCAAGATESRYNALTVANRIETLAAEIRKAERNRDGSTRTISTWADGTKCTETFGAATGNYRQKLEERVAELTDQLSYWQQIRAEQIAAGQATNYGPDTIAKGDAVKIRNRWYEVVRVNKKTVTVPSGMGSWTDTSPYREVQDHRPAGAPATA